MIFVGSKVQIYTRAILANQNICMHDFCVGGGAPIICGGERAPQAPRSYASGGSPTVGRFFYYFKMAFLDVKCHQGYRLREVHGIILIPYPPPPLNLFYSNQLRELGHGPLSICPQNSAKFTDEDY